MGLTIDLNCDMGEGCVNDAALMDFVSSVNIACGFHAGDADTMRRTVDLALEKGVAIGAHPGYRDRADFGRTQMSLPLDEVREIVVEQINDLREICTQAGAVLRHVKPHGALYNQAAKDPALSRVIAEAVNDIDPDLVYFGLAGSVMIAEAKNSGLRTAGEVFADRTYWPDGSLTPRSEPNALIARPDDAVSQVMQMIEKNTVTAVDGSVVPIKAETVCIHGDGQNALAFAQAVFARLTHAGITVAPI